MLASQRHNQIQQLLAKNGAVTVAQLTELFGISMETVRRDLSAMEQAGRLTCVHGGALPAAKAQIYSPLQLRLHAQTSEKHAIAQVAAKLVEEGDYISIGGGSTAVHFARALKQHIQNLTVVTYSKAVFDELRDVAGYQVIMPGGRFDPKEDIFYGDVTLQLLARVHVHKGFLFPFAVSLEHGLSNHNQIFCESFRQLLRSCDQAYVLSDHSKFERTAPYRAAAMLPEYIYITDAGLPQQLRQLYAENGLQIITAPK